MIDEARTLEIFGYMSEELAPKSMKRIAVLCEECGRIWTLRKQDYHSDICKWCVQRDKYVSDETKQRNSEAMKRRPSVTEDTRKKMRESNKGSILETQQHMSAGKQGIFYDDWESFACESKYCPKFNNACRESNRGKYGRYCFLTGVSEAENTTKTGDARNLSVHHVDMDKMQGCTGNRWKLVPLLMGIHTKIHSEVWGARIEYLLEHVWYPDGVWTPDALC